MRANDQRRRSVHVGPVRDEEIVHAVESAGGWLADDLGDASAAIVLSADQGYFDRICASEVEWIQLPWAGIDHWDLPGSSQADRVYTSAGPAYAPSVAEHAIAMSLALHKGIHTAARQPTWNTEIELRQLRGAGVLLLGTGHVGAAILKLLQPWGNTFYGVNRSGRALDGAHDTFALEGFATRLPDVSLIICSLPHTPETDHVIGSGFFENFEDGTLFVNVGRGAVVATDALIDAVGTGKLGGVALDVTDPEPLPDEHPLWAMDNVLITPHIGNPPGIVAPGLSDQVRTNVTNWIAGEPLSGVVHPNLGY